MEKIDSKENLIRLVNQYQNLIFSICLKLTGAYFVSEDITQDTFLTAFEQWENFDGNAEKAWLCRIAGNKCIDWKRKAERRSIATDENDMPEQATTVWNEPLAEVLNKEIMHELEENCDKLSNPYREVARSHFLKGQNAKEIATQTGVGLKTVQTRIYRAREMLKKTMRKEELLE